MKLKDLEHIIRACAGITNEYEFVIVGSQSILGSVSNPPGGMADSMELDIYPLNRPELWDLIDGSLGEGSPFHVTFKYYAQGVGPETAVLPKGWKDRLVKVQNQNTNNFIGLCISPGDLAASKLVAGRDKDHSFVQAMLDYHIIRENELTDRINDLPVDRDRKKALLSWVSRHAPNRGMEP